MLVYAYIFLWESQEKFQLVLFEFCNCEYFVVVLF